MGKKKILLIDDDADFVDATASVLTNGGYDVIVARNGEEGLEKSKDAKPDLIILDLVMPLREGYSVCRELKESPESASIPVLILTAISKEAREDSYASKIAVDHGADGFANKPLSGKELLDRVQRLLVKGVSRIERRERKKVLIVDDDSDFVNATKQILTANDYEVLVAVNGEEGIKIAKAFLPDVIVLDVMLPDKDGYTVCYELKKEGVTGSIPVIMLTGIGENLAKPEFGEWIAVDHSADDYAEKPIGAKQLLKKIERHVAPYY